MPESHAEDYGVGQLLCHILSHDSHLQEYSDFKFLFVAKHWYSANRLVKQDGSFPHKTIELLKTG